MLNFKKALALTLAAATVFTFAPVSNLGVVANAANEYTYFVDKASETINLTADESTTVWLDMKNKNFNDGQTVVAKVEDKNVAEISALTDKDGTALTYNTTTTFSAAQASIEKAAGVDQIYGIKVTAKNQGTTHILLTRADGNGDIIQHQTLTIVVTGQNLKITKSDDNFWVNDNTYIQNGNELDAYTDGQAYYTDDASTTKYIRAQVEGAAVKNNKNVYFTVQTSDAKEVSVVATSALRVWDAKTSSWANGTSAASNTEYLITTDSANNHNHYSTVQTSNGYYYKDTDGKYYVNIPLYIIADSIKNKAASSSHASITVKAYDNINSVGTFTGSDVLTVTSDLLKNAHLLGQNTFTVNLQNATPQLSVSYNPADPSKAVDKPIYAAGYHLVSGTKASDTPETIYLDTTKDTTAQLTAKTVNYVTPAFNTSANVPVEYSVDYQGTDRAITVDQNGKISVIAPTAGISEYTNYVVVKVAAVGRESDKSNYIAPNEVRIPVKVSTKDRVSLSVKGVKVITQNDKEQDAKAVGTTGYSESFPKKANGQPDPKGAAAKADIQVSNKTTDGSTNSVALSFDSNVDDKYIDASVYADPALTTKSDIATYNKATKTITAVPGKSGFAYVKVTALNDNKTYGNASVVFVLEVTDKANNAKIAPAKTTVELDRQTPKAKVPVTLTNAKDLVAAVADSDKHPEISVFNTDKQVTIEFDADEATADTGSAIVTLKASGKNADTLTPAAQQITVNWHKTKLTSGFWVETQEATLNEGESRYVNYTGAKGAVSFKSADPSVAEVKDNQIIGVKEGSTKVTVTDAGDDTYESKSYEITVNVKAAEKPAAVTGVSVKNKKGAHVTVSWTSQGKNVNYRVYKKVGKGSWKAKNVAGSKTTLSVKKGAKVTVKVKAYVKDSNGKTTWGPKATKAKAFKTDKK